MRKRTYFFLQQEDLGWSCYSEFVVEITPLGTEFALSQTYKARWAWLAFVRCCAGVKRERWGIKEFRKLTR